MKCTTDTKSGFLIKYRRRRKGHWTKSRDRDMEESDWKKTCEINGRLHKVMGVSYLFQKINCDYRKTMDSPEVWFKTV